MSRRGTGRLLRAAVGSEFLVGCGDDMSGLLLSINIFVIFLHSGPPKLFFYLSFSLDERKVGFGFVLF